MALDIDKVRAASVGDFCALLLCEFSRFVDAIERIAPDASASTETLSSEKPKCPCPPELRQKRVGVMGEPVIYECGVCKQPVEA